MPLTLDKLFAATVESTLDWEGEVVHLVWAPARYTGEMDEFAETLASEMTALEEEIASLGAAGRTGEAETARQLHTRKSARMVRTALATLLVSWDVLDGDEPIGTDEASLLRLPSAFLLACYIALGAENQVDPPKAPTSPDGPETQSSAPSQGGTRSSAPRTTSASRRGTSNREPKPRAITRSGARGR